MMGKVFKIIMSFVIILAVSTAFTCAVFSAEQHERKSPSAAKRQEAITHETKNKTKKDAPKQKETKKDEPAKVKPKGKYKISGYVKNSSGEGVSKVSVMFPHSLISDEYTDGKGFYETEVKAGTTLNISLEKKGYVIKPATHTIADIKGDTTVNFTANIQKFEVRGHVAEGKAAIEGVELTLIEKESDTEVKAVTDKTGNFNFKNLEYGKSYQLTVQKEGFTFKPEKQDIKKISDNITLDIKAKAPPLIKLSGTVTDGEKPVSGALVTVKCNKSVKITTNAQGHYHVTIPAFGSCTVSVSKAGLTFVKPSVSIEEISSDQTINFTTVPPKTAPSVKTAVPEVAAVKAAPQADKKPVSLTGTEAQKAAKAASSVKVSTPEVAAVKAAPQADKKPVSLTGTEAQKAAKAARPVKVSILATVLDKKTALPIEGIKVTFALNNVTVATVTANSKGEAVFADAKSGETYTVTVDSTDYDFSKPAVTLKKVDSKTKNVIFEGTYKHNIVSGVAGFGNAKIAGAVVKLMPSGLQATTGEDGTYKIKGVKEGVRYTLSITRKDVFFEKDKAEFTGIGEDITIDFKPVIAIEGRVTARAKGVEGVNIFVNGKAVSKTDAQGKYLLKVDGGSDNLITASGQGYSFYPLGIEVDNADKNTSDKNFVAVVNASGKITHVGGTRSAAGVNVELIRSGKTVSAVKTDSKGYYLINNLELSGDYIIKPSLQGHRISPQSVTVHNARQNILNQDFTVYVSTYTVSGTVTIGARGVRNAEIAITRRPIKYYTDGNGNYEINNLDYGLSYTVSAKMPGSNAVFEPVTISRLEKNTKADFNADLKISGVVLFEGAPVTNATLDINGRLYKVNAHGEYVITGLKYGGEYLLKVTAPGYEFDHNTKHFASITSSHFGQNFTAERRRAAK
jgi:hypothetical protein